MGCRHDPGEISADGMKIFAHDNVHDPDDVFAFHYAVLNTNLDGEHMESFGILL